MKRRSFLATIGALILAPAVKVAANQVAAPMPSTEGWREYPVLLEEAGRMEFVSTPPSVKVTRQWRLVPSDIADTAEFGKGVIAYEFRKFNRNQLLLSTTEIT